MPEGVNDQPVRSPPPVARVAARDGRSTVPVKVQQLPAAAWRRCVYRRHCFRDHHLRDHYFRGYDFRGYESHEQDAVRARGAACGRLALARRRGFASRAVARCRRMNPSER